MTSICVNFETWATMDGLSDSYKKGEEARFAIMLKNKKYKRPQNKSSYLIQKKYSEYSFCGIVTHNFTIGTYNIIVVDTGVIKLFFPRSYGNPNPRVGQTIEGEAELFVYYNCQIWDIDEIENFPNVYYNYKVDKIMDVLFPEEFIYENDDVIILPTTISPSEFTKENLTEIQDLDDSESSQCLLDLVLLDSQE